MRDPHGEGHVPPGETSASPERASQRLTGQKLTFDLAQEVDRLRQEESWQRGDRNAKTLLKEGPLRLVLTTLKAGAHLDEHDTDGPVTVQAVRGHLRLKVDGQTVDLNAGQVLSLGAGVRHDVTAVDESAFLVTICLLKAA